MKNNNRIAAVTSEKQDLLACYAGIKPQFASILIILIFPHQVDMFGKPIMWHQFLNQKGPEVVMNLDFAHVLEKA